MNRLGGVEPARVLRANKCRSNPLPVIFLEQLEILEVGRYIILLYRELKRGETSSKNYLLRLVSRTTYQIPSPCSKLS